ADMQVAGGGRSETSFNRQQLPFKHNAKWRAMLANAPSCRTTMTAGAGRAPIAAMATPWSVRKSTSNFRHTLSPPRSVLLGSLRPGGADRVGDEAESLLASPLRCRHRLQHALVIGVAAAAHAYVLLRILGRRLRQQRQQLLLA